MSNSSSFFGGKAYRGLTLKAWAKFTGAGSLTASFNLTSLTRTGVGVYNIVFTNALAGTAYMVPRGQIALNHTGTFNGVECSLASRTTTTATATMKDSAGVATDFGDVYLEFWE